MTQTAVVTRIYAPGVCEVRVRRAAMCGDVCSACSSVCDTPDIEVLAINREGAAPGDTVLIEGSRTLALAALVYMVPLLLFFAGWYVHPIAGAVGILIGIAGVMLVNRFLQEKGGISAKVISVIERAD
jgi:positive regulator of sigma E activity